MKIYGNGSVWNPVKHERAFEFSKAPRGELGVFETDDVELIELAKKNGFAMEGEEPKSEVEKPRRGRPPKE